MSRTYITVQGDMYDYISLKEYGTELLGHRLMEANPALHLIRIFGGGITLQVPDMPAVRTVNLVPWKDALQLPSP
jgi:phage tail protein X